MKNSKLQNQALHGIEDHFQSSGKNAYIVPFFNFLYYIGYFPFKVAFDVDTDKYFIKTHGVQQVLCAISQATTSCFITYFIGISLIKIMSMSSGHAFANIFDVVSNIGLVTASAFCMHASWRRRQLILELIERTRVAYISYRKLQIIGGLVYCSITILIAVLGIVEWHLMKQYSMLEQGTSWVSVLNSSSEQLLVYSSESDKSSDGTFFDAFGDIDQIGNSEDNTTNTSIGKGFAKNVVESLLITLFVYLSLFYATCQAFFMILALTMKQIGYEFGKKLELCGFIQNEGDENSGLNQGIQLYSELKQTTDLIKKVFGNAMIGCYVSVVAYLAEAPHVLIGKRGNYERIVMIYTAFSTLIWIFGAEFHHQIRSLVLKWTDYHFTRNDLSTDDRLKIFKISYEISSDDTSSIAMSNKCFSVTYRHLCSMLSLIVTYGIIVFQLHQSHLQTT